MYRTGKSQPFYIRVQKRFTTDFDFTKRNKERTEITMKVKLNKILNLMIRILTGWPWDSWVPVGPEQEQLAWPFLFLFFLPTFLKTNLRQRRCVMFTRVFSFLFEFFLFLFFFWVFWLFSQAKRGFVAIENQWHKRFRPPLHVNSSTEREQCEGNYFSCSLYI